MSDYRNGTEVELSSLGWSLIYKYSKLLTDGKCIDLTNTRNRK